MFLVLFSEEKNPRFDGLFANDEVPPRGAISGPISAICLLLLSSPDSKETQFWQQKIETSPQGQVITRKEKLEDVEFPFILLRAFLNKPLTLCYATRFPANNRMI